MGRYHRDTDRVTPKRNVEEENMGIKARTSASVIIYHNPN